MNEFSIEDADDSDLEMYEGHIKKLIKRELIGEEDNSIFKPGDDIRLVIKSIICIFTKKQVVQEVMRRRELRLK